MWACVFEKQIVPTDLSPFQFRITAARSYLVKGKLLYGLILKSKFSRHLFGQAVRFNLRMQADRGTKAGSIEKVDRWRREKGLWIEKAGRSSLFQMFRQRKRRLVAPFFVSTM
jgi:hypothetical protein